MNHAKKEPRYKFIPWLKGLWSSKATFLGSHTDNKLREAFGWVGFAELSVWLGPQFNCLNLGAACSFPVVVSMGLLWVQVSAARWVFVTPRRCSTCHRCNWLYSQSQ